VSVRRLVEPAGPWMQTAMGLAFPLTEPTAADVDFHDLVTGLAWTTRFLGHAAGYPVATHCLLISYWLEAQGHPVAVCLAGLLHDAHEAYLGDVTRPVQEALWLLCPGFRAAWEVLKRNIDAAILESLGLTGRIDLHHPAVKDADVRILVDERDQLWATDPPFPWFGGAIVHPLEVSVHRQKPEVAMMAFIKRYEELRQRLDAEAA
jgi:hypothetical protein